MGCATSNGEVGKPGKRDTVFGVLQVKLQEAHIYHQTSRFTAMDPYVNIKFSNQTFKGPVVKNGGKNPKLSGNYQFIVNSYFKTFGRCLEVELMDSNIASDDPIGYGIIDLDPYLNILQTKAPEGELRPAGSAPTSSKQIPLRCFLNYDRKQAGIVNLLASFTEQKTDIVSFRFQTAQFLRSTRTFGDMECYIRVTAGEEVLETKKSKDTKTDKPVWHDEHLSFTCPKSVKQIYIEVMDENDLIGSLTMQKDDLLLDDSENQFKKEFKYKNNVAGTLLFNTKKNANPLFKELKGDYKKKLPEPQKKEEKKGEDKKGEDNKENKDIPKKQEPKQQPKPATGG